MGREEKSYGEHEVDCSSTGRSGAFDPLTGASFILAPVRLESLCIRRLMLLYAQDVHPDLTNKPYDTSLYMHIDRRSMDLQNGLAVYTIVGGTSNATTSTALTVSSTTSGVALVTNTPRGNGAERIGAALVFALAVVGAGIVPDAAPFHFSRSACYFSVVSFVALRH